MLELRVGGGGKKVKGWVCALCSFERGESLLLLMFEASGATGGVLALGRRRSISATPPPHFLRTCVLTLKDVARKFCGGCLLKIQTDPIFSKRCN
jgi:hypothetical protein